MSFTRAWAFNLRGAADDAMLLSYALNPTHASQTLADVAARHGQVPPATLTAAAAVIESLVPDLAQRGRTNKSGECLHKNRPSRSRPFSIAWNRRESGFDTAVRLTVCRSASALELDRVGERIFGVGGPAASTSTRRNSSAKCSSKRWACRPRWFVEKEK